MSYYLLRRSRGGVTLPTGPNPFDIIILGVDRGVVVMPAIEGAAFDAIAIEVATINAPGDYSDAIAITADEGSDFIVPAEIPPDVEVPADSGDENADAEIPPDYEG